MAGSKIEASSPAAPAVNLRSKDKLWVQFVGGAVAGMVAETATVPIDVTKVRLQLQGAAAGQTAVAAAARSAAQYKRFSNNGAAGQQYAQGAVAAVRRRGMVQTAIMIANEEGFKGLYKGLTPALLRQCVYGGLRVGTYDIIRSYLGVDSDGTVALWKKGVAGMLSGALGSAVATPTDLVKVRMQAEGRLAPGQAPRYRNTLDAFLQIAKKERLRGLWQGWVPTVQRATLINAMELGTYDQCKELLLKRGVTDGVLLHLSSSLMAGFLATVVAAPVDLVKTRIMQQPVGPTGEGLYYSGTFDCLRKTVQGEGMMGLYKGFVPNYLRIGPWCVIMFMCFEQLKLLARQFDPDTSPLHA